MAFKAKLKKVFTPIVWGNLLAMLVVAILLGIGVFYWLDYYTMHGQTVRVPDVKQKQEQAALEALEAAGLEGEVRDTGYVAGLPAGIILEQSEAAGKEVKPGRIVYLTINSGHARLVNFPDIADNSSLREAQVRLQAMGFSLAPVRYTHGEKDWVYEVRVNGKSVRAGERVPSNAMVTLFVGSGYDEMSDSLFDTYSDDTSDDFVSSGNTDDVHTPTQTPPSAPTTPTTPRRQQTAEGYDF